MAIFVPISLLLVSTAPEPVYVTEAERVLSVPHGETSRGLIMLSNVPLVASLSTAAIMAWSGILLLGCILAGKTSSRTQKRLHLAQGLTGLTVCVAAVSILNLTIHSLGWFVFPQIMDAVILWNWCMAMFFAYLTIALKNSGVFRCVMHYRRMRARARNHTQ